MKKIKMGCIGLGGIFNLVHFPAYLATNEAEIVAVCDIIEEKMYNGKFSNSIKKYKNYKDLLNDPDIDAVDICTPNYLHSIIAIEALKKGKDVFCEKPDAISAIEMEKMIEAEKESGKTLMIMRNNRHLESSKCIKNIIKNNELGDIYTGRCGWIRRRGIPGKGGWFTTKEESGGGPLIDLGVHVLDLAIYLMGNPKAVSVSGSIYTKFADNDVKDSIHSSFGEEKSDGIFNVEDLAIGFIKFENGSSLQFEFSWASNIKEEKTFIEFRGDKAGLSYNFNDVEIFSEKDGVLYDSFSKTKFASEGHKNNLYHFFDVLNKKTLPDYTTEQGLNIIKIIDAVYLSAQTGKEVLL